MNHSFRRALNFCYIEVRSKLQELTFYKKAKKGKMNDNPTNTGFYKELEHFLPASTAEERSSWANTIVQRDMDINYLSGLLKGEQKTASRFLWLLSDVGALCPDKLYTALPFLFGLYDQFSPAHKTSFATFWLLAGVPAEHEGIAVNLLFQWLISSETNVTVKSRSLGVLFELTKKYPELKNELKLCLKEQSDKHTKDFKKRADRMLAQLEQ
jgi:hypothetical protein